MSDTTDNTPYEDDAELAAGLAEGAGRVLLDLRDRVGFADPAALRAAGDRGAQEFLANELATHRPGDSVLSEEAADSTERLGADRVWIIDPLDGTREFSEQDRDDWAVHVALWERGELTAAAVALPGRGTLLSTANPPAPPAPGNPPRIAVSRTRPPGSVPELAEALGAELVPMGSAGVKISAVLLGQADAYVHAGGQYEWDSAAPVAVARAAGAHTSRVDGAPLVYNRPDARLPDLVVCRPDLAERVLAEAARLAW